MTPYEKAAESYHNTKQEQTWSEFLSDAFHSPTSYVVDTPSLFVVAREVDDATLAVEAAAGDLRELVRYIPWRVTSLIFQRRNSRVHTMVVDRLKSFIGIGGITIANNANEASEDSIRPTFSATSSSDNRSRQGQTCYRFTQAPEDEVWL